MLYLETLICQEEHAILIYFISQSEVVCTISTSKQQLIALSVRCHWYVPLSCWHTSLISCPMVFKVTEDLGSGHRKVNLKFVVLKLTNHLYFPVERN